MAEGPRILLHNDDTAALAQVLKSGFPQADVAECNSYADLPGVVAGFCPEIVYSVRFDGTPGFPRDALFGPQGPRWIANGGAGTDHFGRWDPAHVTVTNAAGVAADMMAEYILGGFLHFTLDVPGLQEDQSARRWQARRVRPLKGQTLLILGLGHTGRALAERAQAFGMSVLGTRARPERMAHVDEVHPASAVADLLPRADFIALATPLTSQTKGMIGWQEIQRMKPGVILADVSRGGVLEHSALLRGFSEGIVAAAVLDVFPQEPLPSDDPLWGQRNVLISPHCSSVWDGWERASFELFLANLARWCAGETLHNIVDPHRGY